VVRSRNNVFNSSPLSERLGDSEDTSFYTVQWRAYSKIMSTDRNVPYILMKSIETGISNEIKWEEITDSAEKIF